MMEKEKQKVWAALSAPPGLVKLTDYGDLLTVADFLENVEDGGFIDYDGHGHWACETLMDTANITPSKVRSGKQVPPVWATHVMWYNR